MAKPTPRKRSIYGSGSGALTPTLPTNEAADMLDRQQLLGNLENKLNAQQKRIADNERFIKVMKKEATEMRKLITNLRAAYFENITLRPAPIKEA
jgi:hypothetical protein